MSEVTIECKVCAKPFNHTNNRRIYCSDCKPHVRRLTAKNSIARIRAVRKLKGLAR